jgi:outer membrane protein assembly factor BamA
MSRWFCRFRPLAVPGAALLVLSGCATVRGSDRRVLAQEVLVERVTIQGASSVRTEDLHKALFTQPTRCRGTLILKPICSLTQWAALVETEYLERPEVERDALRLEVLYFRRGYREASVRSEIRAYGRGVEVAFTIEEGEPTIVQSFSLTQTQELLTNRQIRRARLPGEGEPLDLARLEAGLFELRSRLADRGYLDAKATDHIDTNKQHAAFTQGRADLAH